MAQEQKVKVVYKRLQERLDRNPTGAPASATLFEILDVIFGEECARVAAKMPMVPAGIDKISRKTGVSAEKLLPLLEKMAGRGIVMDMPNSKTGKTYYYLLPPVVGFFEFSLMSERDDIPQKRLAELIEKYENENKRFVSSLFRETVQVARALVDETARGAGDVSGVLDYEKASEIIDRGGPYAVALCYCRHKKRLADHACGKPEEICLSFGGGAEYFIRNNIARKSDKSEMLDLLEKARENGLVQIADNCIENVGYICNCCGCCCGMLRSINHHGISYAVHTSNFIASADETCTGCGMCEKRCPINAIEMREVGQASTVEELAPSKVGGERKPKRRAVVDEKICLGCGVCARACKKKVLEMKSRTQRVLTPESTLERLLIMSVERGTLQHLLFDEFDSPAGDFMKTFAGAVLQMPATKRLLLSKEVKSRFLDFANKRGN